MLLPLIFFFFFPATVASEEGKWPSLVGNRVTGFAKSIRELQFRKRFIKGNVFI